MEIEEQYRKTTRGLGPLFLATLLLLVALVLFLALRGNGSEEERLPVTGTQPAHSQVPA